jgi:uncharacterized radical SAM superfamily Fe-S cluster-containing enzyme
MKLTTSLCPVCYEVIPAVIAAVDCVVMTKNCPKHGTFSAIVEPDSKFYQYINSLENNSIYDGLLVDITDHCNLQCAVCLHDNNKVGHLTVNEIVGHCRDNADKGPFFLSGGEPTTHPGLLQIITEIQQFGGVGVITNGVKLSDTHYLAELAELFTGDVLPIAFSVHPEADVKQQVIDNFRAIGKKLSSLFWVVTSLDEIPDVMKFYRENSDVICQVRIKAATNVWKTQTVNNKLFVSDILAMLSRMGNVVIDTQQGNKSTAINCIIDELPLMLVSWYDKFNIDLQDIDCPPYYLSKDGIIRDFLSASILNEAQNDL